MALVPVSSNENVLWKCGSCSECFCDINVLASHKCMGAGSGITVVDVQSFEIPSTANTDHGQDDRGLVEYSYHKPTIISVKNSPEVKKLQKGKRSFVWTFFTPLEEKKVVCSLCRRVIPYCGTPTNLVYHLTRHHPKEADEIRSKEPNRNKYQYFDSDKLPKKRALSKTINTVPKRELILNQAAREVKITHTANTVEIMKELLLVDMMPAEMLDTASFKKLIRIHDPKFKLPSKREFFNEYLPNKYIEQQAIVQGALKEEEKFHLSVELWIGYNDQRFITVSAHFVNHEFEYNRYALSTVALNDDLTSENIMSTMLNCITQWDISLDIMCIVTDDSDIMVKAAELTGWKSLVCFAHLLDGIIKEALSSSKELKKIFKKCRRMATILDNNEDLRQQFLEMQIQDKELIIQSIQGELIGFNTTAEEEFPLHLKKDSPREWISTFYMLQRIVILKNIILSLSPNIETFEEAFTLDDWIIMEETIALLKSFEVVILELCNEPFQLASKVIPVSLGLMSLINDCNELTTACIEKLRLEIITSLERHLGNIENNMTLALATVLDPRFKTVAFQSETAVDAVDYALKTQAKAIIANDANLLRKLNNEDEKNMSSCTDSLWAIFEKKATPKKVSATANQSVLSEIKTYLEEPLLGRKENPFVWWKRQGQLQFPILSKLAMQMLGIPATSIPAERVFLKKGRTFSEKRKSIKPRYIDHFLFLSLNSR